MRKEDTPFCPEGLEKVTRPRTETSWPTRKRRPCKIADIVYKAQKILGIKTLLGRDIPLDDIPVFSDWSVVEKHQNGFHWEVEWDSVENPMMDVDEDNYDDDDNDNDDIDDIGLLAQRYY
ncbi:hypothetical protein PHYBLDRAFT_67098 [Phycomyces blakesleeanus NRRL 1555(-)]|uniref:Uncharacterized protein n=1 Tax=Phycomyces blakesleeanus (strain ATCC 8743b / DSM 1359 / FGSC 10004 / NBRC 33097 / NRRL 1555) TaxID=763407 RepID=A0A162TQJ1_PHYB8|nr:hypothetical protein PHYBLDRAFT_67098 [Phycomyces blakesleeanus NRRL 1555(-)]OAD69003.1 hypothetical protein PHYBLDRAFT_67098 [Phycomyces blakesleeanus NRRL 1555(-)]|eukprot:XP_018287043.1 hypothetical protein PHYBLDRAFT_67098 [Phycomyces blakesleeanus NRRL 1555(-)]